MSRGRIFEPTIREPDIARWVHDRGGELAESYDVGCKQDKARNRRLHYDQACRHCCFSSPSRVHQTFESAPDQSVWRTVQSLRTHWRTVGHGCLPRHTYLPDLPTPLRTVRTGRAGRAVRTVAPGTFTWQNTTDEL